MTETIIFSGHTSGGITANDGDLVDVLSGGVAEDTIVNNGGIVIVAGGTTTDTTVNAGGVETVSSGGTASGSIVDNGGGQVILSGGSGVATVINNGGFEVASGGAVVSGTTVGSGGTEQMFGAAVSYIVAAGGQMSVSSGGTATGTTVSGAGATDLVASGGNVVGSILIAGGTESIFLGGSANATVVSSGGNEILSGGTASGTHIVGGGLQTVSSGGLTLATLVDSGGVNAILSGGMASGTTLRGGSEIVFAGGTAGFGAVKAGGNQILSAGGVGTAMTVAAGGFEMVSSGGVALSITVNNGGNEDVFTGGTATATVVNSGGFAVALSGGVLSGTMVGAGGTEVISGGGIATATVVNSGGEVTIRAGGTVAGTFLNAGGFADLPDLLFVSGASSVTLDSGTDVLTVTAGGNTFQTQLTGDYTGEFFHAVMDAGNGTLVTLDGTPCYCRGTRIRTHLGETEVENLRIGDKIVNMKGEMRRVRWIGRRGYAGRFAAGNHDILPVLIRAGALEEGVPRRDLMVSPLHAMYLDDVLIPARLLVNGSSIVQLGEVDQVEYFHIELDTHDIILAEGALSETFVDDDSRGMFINAAEFGILYPDEPRTRPVYCAPRVEDGEILEAARRRLTEQAWAKAQTDELPSGQPASARLLGNVDATRRDRVTGWAFDEATPDAPVRLRIYNNGVVIGEVTADLFRADLKAAGIGDGGHAFELAIPGGLSPLVEHVIHVRRAADGRDIPNTPCTLRAERQVVAVMVNPDQSGRSLNGCVDEVTRERISGWARDPSTPDEAVALQILDNGLPVARVLANMYRPDLEQAGIGNGRHGFDIIVPGGLSPLARHVVEIRSERDGTELAGSPVVIEPANSFDATLEQTVANAVASLAAAGEQERVLSFILAQAERLRQRRADADGQVAERRRYRAQQRREGPTAADLVEPGKRALVLDVRYPSASRDAGSQAVLSHIRALQQLGYAVSFAAAEDTGTPAETIAALEAQGIACHRAPFYSSVEDVLRRQAVCFDVVYLHRAEIASRYLSLVRAYFPRARIVWSVADLHHVRLERQAAVEERPELLAASRRMRLAECTAAWSADAIITHSHVEAEILRHLVPEAQVHEVLWDIPVRPLTVPPRARNGLAFIGGYGHTPNQDAARWLVEDIMPLVWRTNPAIECLLVGSEMPATVRNLARPGVVVVGEVEDIGRSVFDRVRLTVAPVRYGAGVKGKVLDSLAAGVPCVMTPIAAEGIALPPPLRALIGADEAALASLICSVHEAGDDHDAAVTAGLEMIRDVCGREAIKAAMSAVVEGRTTGPVRARSIGMAG